MYEFLIEIAFVFASYLYQILTYQYIYSAKAFFFFGNIEIHAQISNCSLSHYITHFTVRVPVNHMNIFGPAVQDSQRKIKLCLHG
jgi:hypothetical protein